MNKSIIFTALVLLLTGCSDPVQGIFYSIEKEAKTGDSSNALPNTVTVLGTAVRSAGAADEQLFVAANSLYRRSRTSDWERLSPSFPGLSAPAVYDVAALGSTLYVVAGQDSARQLFSSTDGQLFTKVDTGAATGNPEGLVEIQGDTANLLVTWNTGSAGFQAYALDAGGFRTLELLPAPVSTPLVQALYTGTEYYGVNGSLVYTGSSLASQLTAGTVVIGGVSAGNLGGIIHSSVLNNTGTKEIILSTNRGMLIRRVTTPAPGWENYPGLSALTTSTGNLELTTLVEWDTGKTPAKVLLAGALGSGYAEAWYDTASSTASLGKTGITVDSVGFVNSALGKKTVTGFRLFNGSLYAESAAGLWKYDGSVWNWE